VLSVLHPPSAARAFKALLGSDDAQLRIMSCQGLAREPPTRALDAAVGARVADPLAPVRQVCAKALASWPSTRQGKVLALALSKESDPDARLAEIEALGGAAGSASAKALEPLLASPRQAERYAAARSLARRGVPEGQKALSGWLSALDAGVRADAVALVAPIPGRWAQAALAERLDDPDASVCIAAARALIARKDARGLTALVLRAERANAADKGAFERALAELQVTQAQRLDIIERAQPKKVAPAPQ